MRLIRKRWLFIGALLVLVLLAGSFGSATAAQTSRSASGVVPAAADPNRDRWVVVRVYYRDAADLNQLASRLDVWEVNHTQQYLLAMLS